MADNFEVVDKQIPFISLCRA